MYTFTFNGEDEKPLIKAYDTKVGDLMRICAIADGYPYDGKIILRTFTNFVLLEDPGTTWDTSLDVYVELLKPGESVTLTVKE